MAKKPDTKVKATSVTEKAKGLQEEIMLPAGVNATFHDHELHLNKSGTDVVRVIHPFIDITLHEGKLMLHTKRERKVERRLMGTYAAHIKNMIAGLESAFVYKLKVATVHFPMSVSYDNKTHELVVKNFLGEKTDRRITLVPGVTVTVKGEDIELKSADIEKAGNVATQIEKGTRVRNKDRRIYQDGIFIVEKPGRTYL